MPDNFLIADNSCRMMRIATALAVAAATIVHGASPNILFILSDDQDALLQGYDPSEGVHFMDKLNSKVRAEGTMFTRYHLAFPLCSPSRSAILTGRFPHNTHFVNNNVLNSSKFHPVQEQHTLPVWLNQSGYHTMLAGKYMNGYHTGSPSEMGFCTYIPDGWGSWYGFQSINYFGTRVNVNGQSVVHAEDDYQTDIIHNYTLAWLKDEWQKDKPFFMWVTPHCPHAPYSPSPKYKGTMKGKALFHQDPAFTISDAQQGDLPDAYATMRPLNYTSMQSIFEERAECLLSVDDLVGDLVDEIDAQGVLDNTVVIYTSDNGYHLGEHRLSPGKREAFWHDITVPFIVRGPGIQKGATVDHLVGNYDVAATILELSGAQFSGPYEMDGKSFVPMLTTAGASPIRTVGLQEGYQTACGSNYHGVRWVDPSKGKNVLYVEFEPTKKFADKGHMYFDMLQDPYQLNNTYKALDSSTQAMFAQMVSQLHNCS
eukprot:gene4353-789_t